MITPEEISALLKQYNIGKKPLSKLLGWGETTIIRYLEGDVPTKEYSDKLRKLLESRHCFYELLEDNRENITNTAYQKSLKTIYEKVTAQKSSVIVHYIENNWKGILLPEGCQCLLYFAQGFYLALYGKVLFEEEYRVTSHKIPYEELKESFYLDLLVPDPILEKQMPVGVKEFLDALIKAFSWYGYQTMEALLIEESNNLRISRDKNNERIVSKDTMEKHFRWVLKEYRIRRPEEIGKYIDFQYAQIRAWKLLTTW